MKGAFWWIDRWRTSDSYANMNAEQRGVYRELIDELWLRGGLITTDEERLSVLAGGEAVWKRVREVVLSKFEKTPLGYRHDVHDEVFGKAKTFKERQSEKGSKRAAEATRQGGRFTSRPAGTPAESPAENQPSDLRSPISGTASPNPNPDTDPGRVVKAEPTAAGIEATKRMLGRGELPTGTPMKFGHESPMPAARLTPKDLGFQYEPSQYAHQELAWAITRLVDTRNLPGEVERRKSAVQLLHDASTTPNGLKIETPDLRRVSTDWAKITTDRLIEIARDVYGVSDGRLFGATA